MKKASNLLWAKPADIRNWSEKRARKWLEYMITWCQTSRAQYKHAYAAKQRQTWFWLERLRTNHRNYFLYSFKNMSLIFQNSVGPQ